MSNSTKVWFFILILSLLHLFAGYQLGGRLGLFVGFMMALSLNALIIMFGDSQVLQKMKARKLEGQDPWGLNDKVAQLCRQLGLPKAQIYILNHSTPSAFSVGKLFRDGAICITTGCIERLSSRELDAVITFQICQMQRFDHFIFNICSTLANSLVGVAHALDHSLPSHWLLKIDFRPFTTFISPVAWLLIRTAISEHRFFENDDMTASVLHDKKSLAQALWKMEAITSVKPLSPPPCTSHLFILNPLGNTEKNWFYLPHPKTATRIERLLGYYPI